MLRASEGFNNLQILLPMISNVKEIDTSIMLIRRIPDKNKAAHDGVWMKEASGSYELRGKTLGIIGYGNIGSQVSVLAEALGMKIIFYDV